MFLIIQTQIQDKNDEKFTMNEVYGEKLRNFVRF